MLAHAWTVTVPAAAAAAAAAPTGPAEQPPPDDSGVAAAASDVPANRPVNSESDAAANGAAAAGGPATVDDAAIADSGAHAMRPSPGPSPSPSSAADGVNGGCSPVTGPAATASFLLTTHTSPLSSTRAVDASAVDVGVDGHVDDDDDDDDDGGALRSVAVLRDVELDIAPNALTAIVGPIAAGKSSLIAAMLGELETLGACGSARQGSATGDRGIASGSGSGKVSEGGEGTSDDGCVVTVRGRVALVPQKPWIINASIKDNILFGRPCDEDRLATVINACCMDVDMEELPDGNSDRVLRGRDDMCLWYVCLT